MTQRLTDPEGQELEYKQQWSDTAKKTMIAFANDMGGILRFGVADDGEIVGCPADEIDRQVLSFARDGVQPPITDLVRVVPETIGGKTIVSVIVAPGSERPYGFRGKLLADGGVFIRLGGQTVKASLEEVFRIIQRGDPRMWESRPSRETALSFDVASQIFERCHVRFDEACWLGYGLRNAQRQWTNLALLLSDQCPHRMNLNRFRADGSLAESVRVSGSLLGQLQKAMGILEDRNVPTIRKKAGKQEREETFPWPPVALREALTNTVAHRDYSAPLTAAVNIYENCITFVTPGGIPPEITLAEALIEGMSFCRNEKLADLFMRLGWMEKIGSGFGDIFREYAPFEQKPVMKHIDRIFVMELPRTDRRMSGKEQKILDFVRSGEDGRSRAEIEAMLGVSRPTTMKILEDVLASGQLIRTGRARSIRYRVPSLKD